MDNLCIMGKPGNTITCYVILSYAQVEGKTNWSRTDISVLVLKVKLYNMSHSWTNETLTYLILETALSVSSGLAQGEAVPLVKLWSA